MTSRRVAPIGAGLWLLAVAAASAPALRSLMTNLEGLDAGITQRAGLTSDLIAGIAAAGSSSIADPSALFARYVAAVERLWQEVDRA